MLKKSGWVVFLMSFGALPALAHHQMNFLNSDTLNTVTNVVPPPKAGSPGDKADTEELLKLQKTRTKADCDRAHTEEDMSLGHFFGPPYGPLTEAEVKKWDAFFKQVEGDAHAAVWKVKDVYKRPRPFNETKSLTPCVKKEDSMAYPSGHATISRVFARVLGELDKGRAAAFMTRADQVALDRVLGGVHHPTDIETGKILGDKVFDALMATPKFKDAMAAAGKP